MSRKGAEPLKRDVLSSLFFGEKFADLRFVALLMRICGPKKENVSAHLFLHYK
jgi:hypothetical protein